MKTLTPVLGLLFTGIAAAQIPGTSRLLLNRDGQSQAYTGVARFRGGGSCTASFLKPIPGFLPETAPAYVITAGHCISMQGPSNEVILDRPISNTTVTFGYFIDTQEQQVRINAKRVSYSSMKATDLAIVELDATYGQLAAKGYRPLEFSSDPPAPAEPILITGIPSRDIPPDEVFLRQVACTHGGEASLVEYIWTFHGFYRNNCADIKGGNSGSPVLSQRTGRLLAILNTTTLDNEYFGGGFDCYLNIPCEIQETGPVVLRDASYAAPTLGVEKCFNPTGVFDPNLPGCPLDRGEQLTLSGAPPNRTTRPMVEDSAGNLRPLTWNTTVSGTAFSHYRYKIGPEGATDCRSPQGYGPVLSLATSNKIDEPLPLTPGGYYLCVQAGNSPVVDSTWQDSRYAAFRHVRVDAAPPILKPRFRLEDRGQDYQLSFDFLPPELSDYEYKLGPPSQTDCADRGGYVHYRRVPIRISKDLEPLKLCVIVSDEAGNASRPLEQPLDGVQIFPDGLTNGASFLPGPIAPGSLASVFGLNLGDATVTILDSAGVRRPARLYLATPGQINFLLPEDTALGPASLAVTSANGRSATTRIQVEPVSPGLFSADSSGRGPAAASVLRLHEDGTHSYQPAFQCTGLACSLCPIDLYPPSDQLFLEVYATGIRWQAALAAQISGLPLEVLSAGPHPLFPVLDRVIVRIPNSIGLQGYLKLTLKVDANPSNPVSLRLRGFLPLP
jgi:uncharacterized protein (TIGR03437 family)